MAAPTYPFSLAQARTEAAPRRTAALKPPSAFAVHCALLVIPLTAILHNALFHPMTCILNSFGPDYTLAAIGRWLVHDPSLFAATLAALIVFRVGKKIPSLQPLALPFVLAFLPLSLWIWDIPLTGRIVCHTLHDAARPALAGIALRSTHLYVLGGALYVSWLLAFAMRRLGGWVPESAVAHTH